MNYVYIQLHAPEPPQRPRLDKKKQQQSDNPYPDYEQSYIIEDHDNKTENSHVVVIEL